MSNPHLFPTTTAGRLADTLETLDARARALGTRSFPTETLKQSLPGFFVMTWDIGVGTATIPTGASGGTATVTPLISPLDSFLFVTPHRPGFTVTEFFADVTDVTSTTFEVFITLLGVTTAPLDVDFEFLVISRDPA